MTKPPPRRFCFACGRVCLLGRDLDRARGLSRDEMAGGAHDKAPSFGFRREHFGETTLCEFFKANDMPTIGQGRMGQ